LDVGEERDGDGEERIVAVGVDIVTET